MKADGLIYNSVQWLTLDIHKSIEKQAGRVHINNKKSILIKKKQAVKVHIVYIKVHINKESR